MQAQRQFQGHGKPPIGRASNSRTFTVRKEDRQRTVARESATMGFVRSLPRDERLFGELCAALDDGVV